MTDETKTGGPAFPPHHDPKTHDSGMTLRDYFAGQAMGGICADPSSSDLFDYVDEVATEAYDIADAMIKARAKQ